MKLPKLLTDLLSNSTTAKSNPVKQGLETKQFQVGTFLMSAKDHKQRAKQLRQENPASRAAVLHELAAKAQEKKQSQSNTSKASAKAASR